jgi:FkbM family methyltransferase
MRIRDGALRLWQRVPLSWRTGFAKSGFATPIRRIMNSLYSADPGIFPLSAPLEGYRMRLEWRSSKAFVFGTYEREVTSTLLRFVRPDWVVFDIGAHVGYFALLLSKLVGPKGKVTAFEPFPLNFQALEENIRLNNCSNVVIVNRAVAARSGTMTLRSNDKNQLTYTASLVQGQPIADVEAVSIDDYTLRQRARIQFAMLDVEGAEAEVLKGMRSTLRRDLPILLIELHGFDGSRESHPALQELAAMNYRCQFLETPGAQVHVLAEPQGAGQDRGGVSG